MKKIYIIFLLTLSFQNSLYSQIVNNDTEDSTPISEPRVRIVVIDPSDVTVTQDHINRLKDIGQYIENFYVNQLTTKGYTLANTNMFARNTDGEILIYHVTSTDTMEAIDSGDGITTTGRELAIEKYTDLTTLNSVFAIVHFLDGGGFTGGGNANNGSMKFQLKDAVGAIDFNSHIAETDYHSDINLKAIHHELGHALTIAHVGPKRDNTEFNTMMGPINSTYEKVVGITTADVRLSDYTAAILAYHPIFRGEAYDYREVRNKNLRIEKIMGDNDLFTVDCSTGIAHLRGKVVTEEVDFHHVVVRFGHNSISDAGGYWNKSFAIETDEDGYFDLELKEEDINTLDVFQYELMVAFNNGLTRGVTALDTDEAMAIGRNQYRNNYTFETLEITQTITESENTLSTDYSDAVSYQWIDCDNNNAALTGATSQSYSPESEGNYAVKVVTSNGCTDTSTCYTYTLDGDTDNDGVPNSLDQCPDTPQGETVNETGCANSQIDEDGDGSYADTDCDDTNANINPNATEIANNGFDDNCDGNELITTTFYQDADGDGFGNPNQTMDAESQPTGYVSDNTDCDDTNANINPNATEIANNGFDDNCDGN
ncbi:putative metal-binding motif-containing protein, partial [uncultured Polaribacter sp.]|uniref:putative metal-binding motif-containing protein n=1 Tax=uncultured Polaribacter sp. TaxID=174711 RepID=UPI002605CA63